MAALLLFAMQAFVHSWICLPSITPAPTSSSFVGKLPHFNCYPVKLLTKMFKSIASLLLFAAIATADSICGPTGRFMVALVCNDGSEALYCAPNNLKDRSQFCANPNAAWATAKCNNKGGLRGVDLDNTGCYTLSQSYWGSPLTCDNPMPLVNASTVNLGFESKDLSGWTTNGPVPAAVVCDSSAPEGGCYAQLTTMNTYPGSAQNVLSRDLTVANYGGCNGAPYKLSFWYKFTAGDYSPFNDYLTLTVADSATTLLSYTVDVNSVGNYGTSGWEQATVNIGAAPTGSVLHVQLTAGTQNGLDGNLASTSYIDGVSVSKAS